jgi:hypothetical protein
LGAKRDKVPKNTFLEWLFKPSIVWQDTKGTSESTDVGQQAPPEDDEGIVGGSTVWPTASAHQVMAVIAPWTEPLLTYLLRKELPDNQTDSRRIVRQSKAYKVHEGELYKLSTTGVLQRCISKEEGKLLLREIHSGMSGHHAAARTLVSKAFRAGFN